MILNSIRCFFGFHNFIKVGNRSTMTFNENSRGFSRGEVSVYECTRCGKVK